MTQFCVNRYVECPFSAAMEFAELALARRPDLYVTPSPPFGERVRIAATSVEDTTDLARNHDALLLAWRPQAQGMFPDFRGVLTIRPKRSGVWMRLTGAYEPPYGTLGKAFDAIAGRMLAQRTMRHLLADLAADIEAQYEEERSHAI